MKKLSNTKVSEAPNVMSVASMLEKLIVSESVNSTFNDVKLKSYVQFIKRERDSVRIYTPAIHWSPKLFRCVR